jgi:2-amino-4-hydroxy-6-hydroxymethyldihydropteridine diphosphokinase
VGADPAVSGVVGLGASLGDRRATLETAARLLAAWPGLSVVRSSRVYASPPAGGVAGGAFLNAAVLVRTSLTPEDLLGSIRAIERRLGRRHTRRWADRVLDLDVLWIDGVVHASEALTVPHPRLVERPFALRPLLDVAPDAREPHMGRRYASFAAAAAPLACIGVLAHPRRRP